MRIRKCTSNLEQDTPAEARKRETEFFVRQKISQLLVPHWQMSPTILKLLKMHYENASSARLSKHDQALQAAADDVGAHMRIIYRVVIILPVEGR